MVFLLMIPACDNDLKLRLHIDTTISYLTSELNLMFIPNQGSEVENGGESVRLMCFHSGLTSAVPWIGGSL
jgi:hypothetical protein